MNKPTRKEDRRPPLNPLPLIGIAIQLFVGVIAVMAATEPGAGSGEFINGRGCAVFLLWLSAFVGGVFGLAGLAWIGAKPQAWRGNGLAWMCLLVAFVFVVGSRYIPIRDKAYDASARSAGRNAKLAEEMFYMDQKEGEEHYTSDLKLLLQIDKNLTDDRKVTFLFLHASESGFTLYTQHAKGTGKTFMFRD